VSRPDPTETPSCVIGGPQLEGAFTSVFLRRLLTTGWPSRSGSRRQVFFPGGDLVDLRALRFAVAPPPETPPMVSDRVLDVEFAD